LRHVNQYVVGLALAAIGNIASAELARDCAPDVEKLLDCPNPYIRKKVCIDQTCSTIDPVHFFLSEMSLLSMV